MTVGWVQVVFAVGFVATAVVAYRAKTDAVGILVSGALFGILVAACFRANHGGGLLILGVLLLALVWWEVAQRRGRAR